MIVSKYVELKINTANIKNLKDKGYENLVYNTLTQVKVEDLTLGSHVKIDCKCFHCKNITNVVYKNYNITTKNNTEDYYCKDCSKYKVKKNNLEKYGVECTLQLQSTKDKIKENNIERYGVEHYSQTNEYKEKIKITNLERYGVEHYLQTEDKQIKSKKTCIDKYGTEYANQSDIVKDKMKETNIERYGVEYPTQNNEIFNKSKETLFKNHGVYSPLKNKEIKNKIKETNIERYGTEYASQSDIVKDKIKETNIERYGISHTLFLDDVTNKRNEKYKEWNENNMYETYLDKVDSTIYDIKEYTDKSFNILHIKCNNIFNIHTKLLYERIMYKYELCTICNPLNSGTSSNETNIRKFIESFNIETTKDRTILKGKELDIYIPSHNLAIEHNGLYYHVEKEDKNGNIQKGEKYHLNKSLECQEKGIHLIHIWEDEWLFKEEIIKSIIKNRLNVIGNKIFARKCIIKEIKDTKLIRNFLDTNHIQGFANSSIKLGLYHNDILVSFMSFGSRNIGNKTEFELIRFCNILDTNVIGASSKLFKYFLKNYSYNEIISYSDFRLFDGKMYETLGFTKIHLSVPEYYWVKGLKRYHRYNFKKHKLVEQGYDINKTEVEIMHERGYNKIWGCGQVKWKFNKEK
mgnify:CR=1 FL=1